MSTDGRRETLARLGAFLDGPDRCTRLGEEESVRMAVARQAREELARMDAEAQRGGEGREG